MNSFFKTGYQIFKNTFAYQISRINKSNIYIENIDFEITDGCNSRCGYCKIWETKESDDVLTSEEIINIFRQKTFSRLKRIIITGGEPFIRNDVKEILGGIHKYHPNIHFALSTNGLSPKRVLDVANFCLDEKIDFAIGISLDDVDEKHDISRGVPGNFRKIESLIDSLKQIQFDRKVDFPIILAHCLSDDGLSTMDNVRNYTQKQGLHFITQLIEEFSYYDNYLDDDAKQLIRFQETPSDSKSALKRKSLSADQIIPEMNKTPSGLRTYHPDNRLTKKTLSANSVFNTNMPLIDALNKLKSNFHTIFLKSVLTTNKAKFNCYSMKSFYFMRANGDVTPCLRFAHVVIGNLRAQSAREVFDGPNAKMAREFISSCDGCANTWAVDWSMEANFVPFTPLLLRSYLSKKD